MSRYYFDRTEDGTTFIDGEGEEFANRAAAERQAIQAAFDIGKDMARAQIGRVSITLRDDAERLLTVEVQYELLREARA